MTQKELEALGINYTHRTTSTLSGVVTNEGYIISDGTSYLVANGIITDGEVVISNNNFSIVGSSWFIGTRINQDGEAVVTLFCVDLPPIEELPKIEYDGKFFACHQDGTLWI